MTATSDARPGRVLLLVSGSIAAFKAAGAHTDKCPMVVGKGARMAAEIILDEEERRKSE